MCSIMRVYTAFEEAITKHKELSKGLIRLHRIGVVDSNDKHILKFYFHIITSALISVVNLRLIIS